MALGPTPAQYFILTITKILNMWELTFRVSLILHVEPDLT